MEQNKDKTGRKSKFLNKEDKDNATRERNRVNQRNSRERKKSQDSTLRNDSKFLFDKDYQRNKYRSDIFNWLKAKPFNQFLTLTCKNAVGKDQIKDYVSLFAKSLHGSGYIGDMFIVYEFIGAEYHAHMLVQNTAPETIYKLLEQWPHGSKKPVYLKDYANKYTRINYVTKALSPCSADDKAQGLIDNWTFLPHALESTNTGVKQVKIHLHETTQLPEPQLDNTVANDLNQIDFPDESASVYDDKNDNNFEQTIESIDNILSINVMTKKESWLKRIKRGIYSWIKRFKNHIKWASSSNQNDGNHTLNNYIMTVEIEKSKAEAFTSGMDELAKKFNNKYIKGELHEVVKLDFIDGNLGLSYLQEVPELVKIAVTMCFVETLL